MAILKKEMLRILLTIVTAFTKPWRIGIDLTILIAIRLQ